MISEDTFCVRNFGRVTDLIYDNRHECRTIYVTVLLEPS